MRNLLDILPKTAYLIGIVGVGVLIAGGIVSYVIYINQKKTQIIQIMKKKNQQTLKLFSMIQNMIKNI